MDSNKLHQDLSDILGMLKPSISDNSITPIQARNIELYLKGASKMLVNCKLQLKSIDLGWNVDVPLMNMKAADAEALKKNI